MRSLTRRATLLAALSAAGAVQAQIASHRPDPSSFEPPPVGKDAYGLDGSITADPRLERALRTLGEPALLTPGARLTGPTFRLLEMRRRSRSARIVFDREDGGATVVLKLPPPTAAGSIVGGGPPFPPEILNRAISGILSLDPGRGLRLRQLLDDEDRFWNGAPEPPNWERIMADSRNEIVVTADDWTVLLEGRVGAKRHALLRSAPGNESWLGQISEQVFGRRNPD